MAAFILGSAAVSLTFGRVDGVEDFLYSWTGHRGFWQTFFACAALHMAVCICATSTLGAVLIPCCTFAYGAVCSFQSALIVAKGGELLLWELLTRMLAPAVLLTPPFFALSCAAVLHSAALRSRADVRRLADSRRLLAVMTLFSVLCALAAAAYSFFLIK